MQISKPQDRFPTMNYRRMQTLTRTFKSHAGYGAYRWPFVYQAVNYQRILLDGWINDSNDSENDILIVKICPDDYDQNCSEKSVVFFSRPCFASEMEPHRSKMKSSVNPNSDISDASMATAKSWGLSVLLPISQIVCAESRRYKCHRYHGYWQN